MPGDREAEYVYMDPDTVLNYLNISFELIGESQLKKRNLDLTLNVKNKIDKVKMTIENHLPILHLKI